MSAAYNFRCSVAHVDVNKGARSKRGTIEVGGVCKQRVITVPNRYDPLNLETLMLPEVSARTD